MWRVTEESLAGHGDRPALTGFGPPMSYRQLAARARGVADALAAIGVRRGDRVALVSSLRRHDEPVALAGALCAGAVVVPLDASAPPRRNAELIALSGCRAVVCDQGARESLPAGSSFARIELDADGAVRAAVPAREPKELPPPAPDLACVLHTSGSTGSPKAVPISWHGQRVFIDWMVELTGVGPADRVLRAAELTFDLAWFDHLAAWRVGAALCTVSRRDLCAPAALASAVTRLDPTVIYAVPALLTRLVAGLSPGALLSERLRVICFAGEVFAPPRLADLACRAPRARLFNLFGPTETNVCTYHPVDRGALDGRTELAIGRACPHAECWLVDEGGRTVDGPGAGELHVRGPTVAGGEHATRDRVERGADGLYYFRGRIDRVVKIRGYRVDPSEIERTLLGCEEVREAAVVVRAHPRLGRELYGYVAARGRADPRQLRRYLSERLPPHLVPRTLALVAELPRTTTGKIDYGALTD